MSIALSQTVPPHAGGAARGEGRPGLGLLGVVLICVIGALAFFASRQGAPLAAIALDDGGWLTVTIGGLVTGLILTPAALGLGLVAATGGPPHLAQSGFVAIGAAVALVSAWIVPDGPGVALTVCAVPIAMLLGGGAGWVFDRLVIAPFNGRPGAAILAMVAAFAFAELALTTLPPSGGVESGPVVLVGAVFGVAAVGVCTAGLRRGRAGKVLRAAAEDPELLSVLGHDLRRLRRWAHVASAALAAGSGVVIWWALPSLMAPGAGGLSDLTMVLLLILALAQCGGVAVTLAATLAVTLIDAYCAALAPGLAPIVGLALVVAVLGLRLRGESAPA